MKTCAQRDILYSETKNISTVGKTDEREKNGQRGTLVLGGRSSGNGQSEVNKNEVFT